MPRSFKTKDFHVFRCSPCYEANEKLKILGRLDNLNSDELFRAAFGALQDQWQDANEEDLRCDDQYSHSSDLDSYLSIIDDLRRFTSALEDHRAEQLIDEASLAYLVPIFNARR